MGLVWVCVALILGGILKGATGAGAPVIAVPVIAIYFDVPTAVAVMVLPNFTTNLIQSWKYRAHLPEGRFPWLYAGGAVAGRGGSGGVPRSDGGGRFAGRDRRQRAGVSITFLNAMKPDRAVFVATISLFFLAMTLVQIPAMAWYGLLTPTLALGSAAALVPLLAAMPLGAVLAKRLPKEVFDKAILLLLAGVACKLLWDALM